MKLCVYVILLNTITANAEFKFTFLQ